MVRAQVDKVGAQVGHILFESNTSLEESTGLRMDTSLLSLSEQGVAHMLIVNPMGTTQEGTQLGSASTAVIVNPSSEDVYTSLVGRRQRQSQEHRRFKTVTIPHFIVKTNPQSTRNQW